jgi:D-glycero-D-manno-heptose 1,7-bisphosphate phosphatase
MTESRRPALFMDRDGTIIEEQNFLADPRHVRFLPGALEALRAFSDAGFALVVVTNQSGIARGLLSADDFAAVQARVDELAAAAGVRFDAVRYCPHHPELTGPCDCRKPGVAMFLDAAAELGLDPAASIYVGDRVRDVLPALRLGGRAFLVRSGYGRDEQAAAPAGVEVVDDLRQLAQRVLPTDHGHRPATG